MIDCGWAAKALPNPPEDIQVGQGRLHQHDIGPFGEIEFNFVQGFGGIGWVHLIRRSVAELRRTFRGLSEWAVKGRGKLRGITDDPGLIKTGIIEGSTHCPDPTIHHIARGNEICAGLRVRNRGFGD